MFWSKARRIKSLEQELDATRVARDYFQKRFAEVSQRLQGRDSKGRFLPKTFTGVKTNALNVDAPQYPPYPKSQWE